MGWSQVQGFYCCNTLDFLVPPDSQLSSTWFTRYWFVSCQDLANKSESKWLDMIQNHGSPHPGIYCYPGPALDTFALRIPGAWTKQTISVILHIFLYFVLLYQYIFVFISFCIVKVDLCFRSTLPQPAVAPRSSSWKHSLLSSGSDPYDMAGLR